MTQAQQDTGLQRPETPLTTAGDRNEPAPGYTDSQVDSAIAQAKRSLDTLLYQRQTTVEGLQKLQAAIEKATLVTDSAKLTSLHAKRRSFEERLEELASEEEVLTRHLEALAQREQQGRVEDVARTRKDVQTKGQAVADTMRHTLDLLEKQFSQWRELKSQDRIAQDILRSLAPGRMTELPYLSQACAVDSNFEVVLEQVFRELHRSLTDLYARTHATEIQQHQEAVRQQDRLAADADRARRQTMAVRSA